VKLTDKEQRNVRAALRFLRHRAGGWQPVAATLERSTITLSMVAFGRRSANAELAFGVARVMGVSIDDLLSGGLHICPHCGRPPDDFSDEETVVEDKVREAALKLVK
jgi:hypothetical protein